MFVLRRLAGLDCNLHLGDEVIFGNGNHGRVIGMMLVLNDSGQPEVVFSAAMEGRWQVAFTLAPDMTETCAPGPHTVYGDSDAFYIDWYEELAAPGAGLPIMRNR